jgi:polysaccharide export outer membrane protein
MRTAPLRKGSLALLLSLVVVASAALADELYRLGEGDIVRLTIYQRPDLSVESRLGTAGRFYVPGGGKINLGGVTIADAEAQIASLLAHKGAVANAQVDLQVTIFGSQKVSVFGYVGKPGAYLLDRSTRLSELIALSGGIQPEGSQQVILLRRTGANSVNRTVINLHEVIANGQEGADPEVQGGDIVTVERAPRVYVYGAVNRPGAYNLEKGMTPLQILSLAGGLSQTGSDGRLEVVRHGDGAKARSLKVGLQDQLVPEDVLIVHESIF